VFYERKSNKFSPIPRGKEEEMVKEKKDVVRAWVPMMSLMHDEYEKNETLSVAVFEINVHGNPWGPLGIGLGGFGKDDAASYADLKSANAGQNKAFAESVNKLSWAQNGIIIMTTCNSGLLKEKDGILPFPQLLANVTKKPVYAAMGYSTYSIGDY